ncbi:MAG: sigma-70 family RNA polymerase sigma factor [bacterium]|nr:sigma-70 family RNA polymerase sigma factor [bacterium]
MRISGQQARNVTSKSTYTEGRRIRTRFSLSNTADPTRDLTAHSAGDSSAADRLVPLIYDRLRALAGSYLKGEDCGHTLQPTALVHEAYVRMVDIDRVDWKGKTHFFAMAARQMRRILVEHARAANAQKRGAGRRRVTLHDDDALAEQNTLDLLALEQALERLSEASPRQARVAELRVFAGLQVKESAHILGVSERTIKQDWRVARAWLARELRSDVETS